MGKLKKHSNAWYKAVIDTIIVVIDTQEKNMPNHIAKCFDRYGIKWERRNINSGDYTARVPVNEELGIMEEIDLADILCIERKQNIDELSLNISTNRERFKREFARTNAEIIIVIEESTYMDIATGNYRSELLPKTYLGGLHSICDENKVHFIFVDKDASALMIYNFLKYRIRSILKTLE